MKVNGVQDIYACATSPKISSYSSNQQPFPYPPEVRGKGSLTPTGGCPVHPPTREPLKERAERLLLMYLST
eukprot:1161293-Pelagomonas_calceolata.AAC.6